MTEYDFSMEGYTKHMERMNKVGQWVDLTNQFPPADPRTAATPGTTIMAPLPLVEHERDFPEDSDDSDDDSYRESRRDREIRRDRDRRDRKGRGSPISGKGRRRDRDRDRPSTSHALSRPPPTRSHTAPIRDRAINLRRESSSTSAGTYDQRHSGSSHDRAPAGRATASQPPYPNSYPIYEPTPKYSGPYPYTPYYPDEQLRPHTSHAHQHHRHPSLPGPAPLPPPPTPAPHTRQRQTRSHSISATVQPHIQTYIHPPPNTTPYGQPYPTAPLHAGLHAQTLRPPLTGTPPVYPFRPTLSSPPKTQHATWHHHQQPPPPVRSQTHPHAHALQQPQPRRFKAIPPEPLLLPPVGMQYIQGQNQGPPVIPQEVSSGSGGMSPTKPPPLLKRLFHNLTGSKASSSHSTSTLIASPPPHGSGRYTPSPYQNQNQKSPKSPKSPRSPRGERKDSTSSTGYSWRSRSSSRPPARGTGQEWDERDDDVIVYEGDRSRGRDRDRDGEEWQWVDGDREHEREREREEEKRRRRRERSR